MLFFITSFFIISIIAPLYALFNLNNYTKKDIVYNYAHIIRKWFNFNLYQVSSNGIIHNKDIIYLSNRVSLADYFIDVITTNYCSKYISTHVIKLLCPLLFIVAKITNNIIAFNKNSTKNISKYFKWIEYLRSHDEEHNNLLVYPTDFKRPNPVEPDILKKGFIYYSYEYDLPIQIVYSRNKNNIINDKNISANRNINVFVYYSKLIEPKVFKKNNMKKEDYYNYIQNYWNKIFFHMRDNYTINKYIDKPQENYHLLLNFKPLNNYIHNNTNNLSSSFLLFRIIMIFLYICTIIYLIYKF